LISDIRTHWSDFSPALKVSLCLLDAELRALTGDNEAAHRAVNTAYSTYDGSSLAVLADIERVLGTILKRSNQTDAAASHLERSFRIFAAAGNIAALGEFVIENQCAPTGAAPRP